MGTHLKLHATQLKQLTKTQTHPVHDVNAYSGPPRNLKATIFHNYVYTNIISEANIFFLNLKHIYTTITPQYLASKLKKKAICTTPSDI